MKLFEPLMEWGSPLNLEKDLILVHTLHHAMALVTEAR